MLTSAYCAGDCAGARRHGTHHGMTSQAVRGSGHASRTMSRSAPHSATCRRPGPKRASTVSTATAWRRPACSRPWPSSSRPMARRPPARFAEGLASAHPQRRILGRTCRSNKCVVRAGRCGSARACPPYSLANRGRLQVELGGVTNSVASHAAPCLVAPCADAAGERHRAGAEQGPHRNDQAAPGGGERPERPAARRQHQFQVDAQSRAIFRSRPISSPIRRGCRRRWRARASASWPRRARGDLQQLVAVDAGGRSDAGFSFTEDKDPVAFWKANYPRFRGDRGRCRS